jgi:SWI/SNF-related matrix-associated actin-dependent regulator of chromatin subfamily A-like protein 1
MPESQLLLADDHLVLIFPYDKEQVDEIKRIKNSKWDKIAKVWRVPLTSLNSARDFAAKHDFWIEPDVLKFDLPEPDNQVFGVMLEKDWIYLSFSFDPVKVKAVKQIPSITWHAKTKSWRAPLTSIHECIDWAKKFREVLPQDLEDLAAGILQKHQESVKESRAVDADISVAGLPLLPYQRAGVKYAAAARRTFIADDMGLGKTIQAIATVEYVYDSYPAVVVCPPNLVLNWVNEYQKWLPSRKVVAVTDRKSFPEEEFDVLVVGYSNITHWEKRLTGMRSYVFDESHYIKTPTSQRTKSAIKMSKSAPPEGIVLALTGTPVTNRPAEYASQLDAIGRLDKFGGLWGFYRRYCGAFRDRFGQWNISGHSNLDELNEKLRGNCYIRRTKDQVLEDLPPVRHAPLVVNGTPAAMKEYRKAEDNIVEYLVARAKEIAEELGVSVKSAAVLARIKAESNEHMVKLSVLRRLAAKAKMEAAKEIVESHIESGQKVVVAAHHRDIVEELAIKFGDMRIQGGMKVEDVEAAKTRFQNEPVGTAPVIVLSIQAAKTGHTLTAAQDVLFMELPWTPADIDQTYSRCHRLGQKGSVTATYLLCEGTVDQQIYDLIEAKRSVVNVATDGGVAEGGESVGQALVGLFTQRGFS